MINEREEILKTLGAGPLVLRRLVRDLDEATLRTGPAEGEWAIIEVVAHLADTEERSLARTRAMLADDEPTLAAYDPDALALERGYLRMDLETELARFERLRDELRALLGGLGRLRLEADRRSRRAWTHHGRAACGAHRRRG